MIRERNIIAARVMKKHRITVNDLYTLMSGDNLQLMRGDSAHWTGEGKGLMAKHVLKTINDAMTEPSIVKDGKANAEIIVAEDPTRMQAFAAEELQHYIKKLTGAEVPVLKEKGDAEIKIYVGKSKYTDEMGLNNSDLDYGAYRMVSGDNYLVLLGNDKNYFRDTPADGGPEYPANNGQRKKAAEAWREKNGKMWSTPFMSSYKGYNKGLGLWAIDKHGSLNAVNDFLRSLGVRWYMPGDFGEYLPEITSIALPDNVNKTVRPDWN